MPRAGLSPDRVVDAAAALADVIGFDQLTLTALAERVGVAVPSLYKHVDGLDDLRRRVAVRAVRDLGAALAAEVTDHPPGTALHAMADAYRRYATEHPGRYAATVQAASPADPALREASDEVLQTVFGVLGEYDLDGDGLVDAARAVRAAIHGFVALEQAGGFGLPRDVDRSFQRLVDTLVAGLRCRETS